MIWQTQLLDVLPILAPIISAGWLLYVRLSFRVESLRKEIREDKKETNQKIDHLDQKFDQRFYTLRTEMKEDRDSLRAEMREDRQETDRKFERIESKLDRIMEMMFMQNQISRAPHFHKKNKKVV